jgi:hypothetical protein
MRSTAAVPVSNSLNLLTAMRAADRPVEVHLFQEKTGIGQRSSAAARIRELLAL